MGKSRNVPTVIAIDYDDYHAKHVGRTSEGRQFFLTTPFVPGGDEFVALYVFDTIGRLLEAHIDNLGPREHVDAAAHTALYHRRLADLGEVTFERIEIAPFAIERFGTTFGLIVRKPDTDDDELAVEVHPGNLMAFHEPWDSGEYDT